jgi:hypothetical protein
MMELVRKSISMTMDDDDEYKKMKQRIFILTNQSLQDVIFYEKRFNVSSHKDKLDQAFICANHSNRID